MNSQDRSRMLLKILIPMLLLLTPPLVTVSIWGIYNNWPGAKEERINIILINCITIVGGLFSIKYAQSEFGWFSKNRRNGR